MASVTPPSSPRSGAAAMSPAVFVKDAARPTKAFCGRSQALWSSLAETKPRGVAGQTAFRQPFQNLPYLGGRARRGSHRTCGSGSWWYDQPRSMSRPVLVNMGGFG